MKKIIVLAVICIATGLFFSCQETKVTYSFLQIADFNPNFTWPDRSGLNTFTYAADLTQDNLADVLAFQQSSLDWYQNPSWEKHTIRDGEEWEVGRVFSTDVDGDGDNDIVIVKRLPDSTRPVVWYENPLPQKTPLEGANWIEHQIGIIPPRESGDYIKEYNAADFDRDGKLDLVIGTFANPKGMPAELFYFFQDDKDHFVLKVVEYENGHEGMDIGDIDLDGDVDVVVNGRWFETPSDPRTGTFIGHNIDEKWYNQEDNWQRNATDVKVADVNGDGRLDVIISHSEKPDYPLSWYSAENPKADWTEHVIDPNYGWCQTLDAGDVDLDGDIDILAGRFERNGPPKVGPPQDVRIYYNNGDGAGWTMQRLPDDPETDDPNDEAGGMYDGQLVDLDNDGDLDAVGGRTYWHGPIYAIINHHAKKAKSN